MPVRSEPQPRESIVANPKRDEQGPVVSTPTVALPIDADVGPCTDQPAGWFVVSRERHMQIRAGTPVDHSSPPDVSSSLLENRDVGLCVDSYA